VVTLAAVLLFFVGRSTSSSPLARSAHTDASVRIQSKWPSVADLRAFLRANGRHPTTCTVQGTDVVCRLAHGGGRCTEHADRFGFCVAVARKGAVSEMFGWGWGPTSSSVVVTSSADFR
jgi:hypothetical protein